MAIIPHRLDWHAAHVRLQPLTRSRLSRLGAEGEAWVAGLPGLLDDLARQWSLSLGRPVPGGSASYVVRVLREDGTEAVLKVATPGSDVGAQELVLRLADGRGYARLLASDVERGALLLESLGEPLERSVAEPHDQLRSLARTLSDAWHVDTAAFAVPLRGSTDKAAQLGAMVERLWDRYDGPCSRRVRDHALTLAGRRSAAFDVATAVVVHGDPHPGNALAVTTPRAGASFGFAFVDPDGFLEQREYDLGVTLRDWSRRLLHEPAEPLLRGFAQVLAAVTGADEESMWEWGFLERVSTGLYVLDIGAERVARSFLDSAERLV